jgi:uncharacterized membrane protein
MDKWLEKEKKLKEKSPEQIPIPRRQQPDLWGQRISSQLGKSLGLAAERLGGWTYRFVLRHWLGIINLHILVFLVGALEAPLLLHLDQPWIYRIVYGFYGFFCHQEPSRSFFLFGNQVAICARCLAFYSSVLVFGMWVGLRNPKPLDWSVALLLIFPSLAGVFLQVTHVRESTNLIRVTSGVLLGMAVSLYLFPRAQKILCNLDRHERRESKNSEKSI